MNTIENAKMSYLRNTGDTCDMMDVRNNGNAGNMDTARFGAGDDVARGKRGRVKREKLRISNASIGVILDDLLMAGGEAGVSDNVLMTTMVAIRDYIKNPDFVAGDGVDCALWLAFKGRVDKSAARSAAARERWQRKRAACASALGVAPAAPIASTATTPTAPVPSANPVASVVPSVTAAPDVPVPSAKPVASVASSVTAAPAATPVASVVSSIAPVPSTKPVASVAPSVTAASAAPAVPQAEHEPWMSAAVREALDNPPLYPHMITGEMRRAGIISVQDIAYLNFTSRGYIGVELRKRVDEYIHEIIRYRRSKGIPVDNCPIY